MRCPIRPVLGAAALAFVTLATQAQTTPGVGIGTATPNAAAALDIVSSTKGVLLPRLTLAQRQALGTGSIAAPVAGLVIFQTDNTPGLYAYDGSAWVLLRADNLGNHTATQNLNLADQLLVGGTAATPGTTGLRVDGSGRVGIGTTAPGHPLTVQADGSSRLLGFNDASGNDKYNFSRLAPVTGTTPVPGGLNLSESNTAGGRLFVQDGTGNVGLGTTAPGQKLEVKGSVYVNNENAGFLVDNQAGARVGLVKYPNREGGLWRATNQDFEMGRVNVAALPGTPSTWTTDLYLGGTGNVGVGTGTPGQKLDVAGGARISGNGAFSGTQATDEGAHLQWNRSGNEGETWLINHPGQGASLASTGLRFGGISSTGTTPTEWARFVANGNLGLGTTTPAQKLDVNGAATVARDLAVDAS